MLLFLQSEAQGPDNVYAAVGKPDAWTALVAELCDLFDANIGMLVATGQGQRDHSFYAAHNHSERLARAYSDHWWQHDVWLLAALKIGNYRTGHVAVGTDLVSTANLRVSAFYKRLFARHAIRKFAGSRTGSMTLTVK